MGKTTGGMLTAGSLIKHFQKNKVHPPVIERLEGSGWFDKLVDGINTATNFYNKNKDTIHKVGKAGFDLYNSIKGGKMHKLKGSKLTAGKFSPHQFKGWKRADIVKYVMEHEHKKLPDASAYVKTHELYQKKL
jgi:hypothetical protein